MDPKDDSHRFAASMTFYGSYMGTYAPTVSLPRLLTHGENAYDLAVRTLGGLHASHYDAAQGNWKSRIMATGSPSETDKTERSLPTADADPQVAYDEYGNLYMTYLSSTHQYGKVTGGGGNTLTDTNRDWVPGLWVSRVITLRPNDPTGKEERRLITGNTATELTVSQAWTNAPAADDTYLIQSGTIEGNAITTGNAVVLLISTNNGVRFTSARIIDSASNPGVDYPALATGPGRPGQNEQSVWVAWVAGNDKVMAAGASVTGLGQVGAFTSETVTGSDWMRLPRAQVGPNGQVMVSFHDFGDPNMIESVKIFTNVDEDGLGPNGFRQAATEVATTRVVTNGHGSAPIPAQSNRGITPGVSIAWDRSGQFTAAPHGRVYLVYTQVFGEPLDYNTDIMVRYSTNSGETWSDLLNVSDGNTKSQFMPAIAVNQSRGEVGVVWLDARGDPTNKSVRLYGTVSVDGGASYSAPLAIAAGRSDSREANKQQRGLSPGNNENNSLNIRDQDGIPNNYWANSNFEVRFNAAPDLFQRRDITASTPAKLTVPPWDENKTPPIDADYVIWGKSSRGAPHDSYEFDYGEYIGLAYHRGTMYPIWPDNSDSTNDNPNGTKHALDLYTSKVWVINHLGDPLRLNIGTASRPEGNSGTTTLSFTVTLSAASQSAVTVNFRTADGTATASDGDYLAASGTLTFSPGETSKTITVPISGDVTYELDETFAVVLFNATNALIEDTQAIGAILNDDTLAGRVWLDANGDSLRDSNEASLDGVTVELLDDMQQLLATTVTADGGYYSFNPDPTYGYFIRFVPPVGHSFTAQDVGADDSFDSDADSSTGLTAYTPPFPSGPVALDAGLYLPVQISGVVWDDSDGDGLRETGEGGLGATVELLDASGTVVRLSSSGIIDGSFLFEDLAPSTYSVRVLPWNDEHFTVQDAGSDDFVDSDVNPITGRTANFTLTSGQSLATVGVGLYTEAKLGGRVWIDVYAGGIQDTEEQGLAGILVHLFSSTGELVATAETNEFGDYQFVPVASGSYYIQFIKSAGPLYLFSPQDQGTNDELDSDVDVDGLTALFTLLGNEIDLSLDAGLIPLI